MDAATTAELGRRWGYRATVEISAARRFARLAERMAAIGLHREVCAIAREAVQQEHVHVGLCADLATRFGHAWRDDGEPPPEVAPATWSLRARTLYEVVAFCCVTETSNTALVADGLPLVDDAAIERAARRILADEVQHSRLGWQVLALHPLDDGEAAALAAHLPAMLAGAVSLEQFRPRATIGDEATLARHGSSPLVARRAAFLGAMREVLLPGLAEAGVDPRAGAAYLDDLEATARAV